MDIINKPFSFHLKNREKLSLQIYKIKVHQKVSRLQNNVNGFLSQLWF
jgi:hypothetical protein